MVDKILGHYEILGPLGAGGMGEVYRARDAKLKREVAIKVLPRELSADADLLARLEREAYLLASLNHPNIATIFSLEEVDDTRFLVLELIDGESLQQRLARGPLPVEEALDVCGQIARALEVAHAEGIVHRDLKPANVLITRDDLVKVLDFGLAKSLRPVGEGDDTEHATELTMAGTLMGTAPYMSPEQVRSQLVDKRSDIWAFGCLFFETLTGTGPFTRETMADTLAAIVGEEPHWESLPAEVSSAVRMLLHRCLQKNPKVRQRDIGDAWVEINQSLSHPGGVAMSMPPTIAGDAPSLRAGIAAGLVIAAFAVGAFAGWWLGPEASLPEVPRYFDFDLPERGTLPFGSGPTIAISPDGDKIVMVAQGPFGRQLFVQRLDQRGEPQPVDGTQGASYPFFSPDGVTIAFDTRNDSIQTISLDGTDSETLCRQCRHGAWGDDNSVIVQMTADSAAGLWARISELGAAMEPLPSPRLDGEALRPNRVDVLPGSRAVLFENGGAIYAFSLDTHELVLVQNNASDPYYVGGYVLFPRDNTLYALPFDAASLSVTGAPIVAQLEVSVEGGGALHAAVSRNTGVLAYAPVQASTVLGFRLGWVDRTGLWEAVWEDDEHVGAYPRVSPDGGRIAFLMAPEPAGIWLFEDSTKVADAFHIVDHVEISMIQHPVWSRDGSSITYRELRLNRSDGEPGREQAIVRKLVSGSRATETLLIPPASSHSVSPSSWTPDDDRLIYGVATKSPHLLVAAPDAAGRDSVLFEVEEDTGSYTLSHDGKWLSYVSTRSGSDVVYVRPFPTGDEHRVSLGEGTQPRWGPDDNELFYIADNQLVSAHLRVTDGVFGIESRETLFDLADYPGAANYGRYDVHPDGNRFAMIRPHSVDDTHVINVTLNWFEEIARLASEGR